MAKGWFQIPGIRPEGDRSVQEQLLGLAPAIHEAIGKTVLDLGCAEGAIAREFALVGAVDVLGVESLEEHLKVARRLCADVPQVRFIRAHLQNYMPAHEPPERFDIVLILGIIHKIEDPAVPLRFACRSCKDLLLFRAPASAWDGNVASKHTRVVCHVPTVMADEGFSLERHIPGARGEGVEYWRRNRTE